MPQEARGAGVSRGARGAGCSSAVRMESTPIEKLPRIVCEPITRPRIAGVMVRTLVPGFKVPKSAWRQRRKDSNATTDVVDASIGLNAEGVASLFDIANHGLIRCDLRGNGALQPLLFG